MEVTRRQFLQLGAGGAAGAVGLSSLGFNLVPATKVKQDLRIDGATVSHSVCPYCAVGCALLAYTRKQPNGDVELLQIEGDPDSPVNEGRLCPKGASALHLAISRRRIESPMYRAAGATEWQKVSWDGWPPT
jgi:formate dehydrogenase major subunit